MTRSLTESKKAPRWLDVPEALATAPSSVSGIPVRMSSSTPTRSAPAPTAIAQATDMARPQAVMASAGMPARLMLMPTGLTQVSI